MDNLTQQPEENKSDDLLQEFAEQPQEYVYASTGQRFLNWLIDNLVMRFTLSYVTGMMIGAIIGVIAPEFFSDIIFDGSSYQWKIILLGYLIAILNYLLYYSLCEKLFKGQTLGKLITGTRAIRQDGQELTFKDALLRSLSRLVPFEVFSGFSTLTWHDSWTDTMVVRSR